jgi:hypothetical protein
LRLLRLLLLCMLLHVMSYDDWRLCTHTGSL